MITPRVLRLGVLALLAATLSGCASLPHLAMHRWPTVHPIVTQQAKAAPRGDTYYADAAAAIVRRDYGRALDLLQAARAQNPNDVRVLNAFGVVYDKLGRFDLSTRYYAQAEALDPKSPILASNMSYSTILQARAALPSPVLLARLEPPAPSPAAAPRLEPITTPKPVSLALVDAPRPAVIRLGAPAGSMTLALAPVRTLEIADATGRTGGAEPVRQDLVRLGWTASKSQVRSASAQSRTVIRYAATSQGTAQALAKTLPRGVELVDCGSSCTGVILTLGADSAGWPAARQSRGD